MTIDLFRWTQSSQDVNSFNESKISQGHQLQHGESLGLNRSQAYRWRGQILRWSAPAIINSQCQKELYFLMYLFNFNKLVKWYVGGDEHESLGTVDISINSASLTLILKNSTCKWEQWFTLRQPGIRDSQILFQGKKKETSPWKVLDLRHYCDTSILAESSFENG